MKWYLIVALILFSCNRAIDNVDTTRAMELAHLSDFQSNLIRESLNGIHLAHTENMLSISTDSSVFEILYIDTIINNDSAIETVIYDTILTYPKIDTLLKFHKSIEEKILSGNDSVSLWKLTITDSNQGQVYLNYTNAYLEQNDNLFNFEIRHKENEYIWLNIKAFCYDNNCIDSPQQIIFRHEYDSVLYADLEMRLIRQNVLSTIQTMRLELNRRIDQTTLNSMSCKWTGKIELPTYTADIVRPIIINNNGCSRIKQGAIEYPGEGNALNKEIDFNKTICQPQLKMKVGAKKYNVYYGG